MQHFSVSVQTKLSRPTAEKTVINKGGAGSDPLSVFLPPVIVSTSPQGEERFFMREKQIKVLSFFLFCS